MADLQKPSRGLTRREAMKGSVMAAVISGAQNASGRQGGQTDRRPNILLVMCDQMRADCVGADGNEAIRTPNLDGLAAEGARFRRAYSSLPSCTPARATLLTGWGPWRHGMLGYGRVAGTYANEMPQMIRDAGYYGIGIGKMHWYPQRSLHGFHKTLVDESGRVETEGFVSDYRQWFKQVAAGLDPDATGIGWNDYRSRPYALDEKLHPTRWTADRAVEFLEGYGKAREQADPSTGSGQVKPFFLKVSFARPHSPYDPPERFFDLYAGADIPKAVVGDWADRNAMRGQTLPFTTPRGDLGPDQVRASRQGYYGAISFLDEQIGRVFDAVKRRGWWDRTLVLFTADHGDMQGDHHLWRKTYAYEGSARVPMLIRWPDRLVKAKRGQVLSQPVELRDVLPTFLDAAGATVDEARFDGRSMLDLVRGKTRGWREAIDLEHCTCYWPANQWCALTDGHMKYIYGAADGSEQLFDLAADPGERTDLAPVPARAAALGAWRKRLADHLAERGEQWVKDGRLMRRPKQMLYGPNYPDRKR